MRVGDLVEWDDPGKDAIGIVMEAPKFSDGYGDETRIPVSFFSDSGVQVQYLQVREIKLVEPRKVNDSR
jgi:hypothetical protein